MKYMKYKYKIIKIINIHRVI